MYKIENLEYKDAQIIIEGYYLSDEYLIRVYQGKKQIFESEPNVFRPDIQAFYNEYHNGIKYGFSYKIDCSTPNFKIFVIDKNQKIKLYKTNNYYIRKKLSKVKKTIKYIGHSIKILWKDYHFIVPISKWKEFKNIFFNKILGGTLFDDNYYNQFSIEDYNNWLKENDENEEIKKLKYNPKISVIIPVFNIEGKILEECLESVLNQTYKNFEICLADDCSTNEETIETLKKYQKLYPEIDIYQKQVIQLLI